MSSGTDALLIALMAAGILPGDYIITTTYTFFATAGAIHRLGAIPLFVDIESDSYNIFPVEIEKTINQMGLSDRKRLKAIVPVHLYGLCAAMESIESIAKAYDLIIVEDAAQAIGAEYRYQRAGSFGTYGCFSCFPSKNLGAYGDGGMVTTNCEAAHGKLKLLRAHGSQPKYYHRCVGGNFRLDALQAAILSVKLNYLEAWNKARQRHAQTYRRFFHDSDLDDYVLLPESNGHRHVYSQFVIKVKERRDDLRRF